MAQPSAPGRSFQIDVLKAVAIVGVLLVHMRFVSRFPADALRDIRVLQQTFAWCVLAFFFCSGFLYGNSSKLLSPVGVFTRQRAERLLVPWLFFWLLYKGLLTVGGRLHAVPSVGGPAGSAQPSWLASFVAAPSGPQLYFLLYLFVLGVVFHASLHLRVLRREWVWWLVVIVLVQSYWVIPEAEPNGEQANHVPAYAASYLTGFLLARPSILVAPPPWAGRALWWVGVAAYGALCAFHPPILHLSVAVVFFYALPWLRGVSVAPLVTLGRRSGAIYAWHTPILMPGISVAVAKVCRQPAVLIVAMLTLTIAASWCVAAAVRRVDKHGWLDL